MMLMLMPCQLLGQPDVPDTLTIEYFCRWLAAILVLSRRCVNRMSIAHRHSATADGRQYAAGAGHTVACWKLGIPDAGAGHCDTCLALDSGSCHGRSIRRRHGAGEHARPVQSGPLLEYARGDGPCHRRAGIGPRRNDGHGHTHYGEGTGHRTHGTGPGQARPIRTANTCARGVLRHPPPHAVAAGPMQRTVPPTCNRPPMRSDLRFKAAGPLIQSGKRSTCVSPRRPW